MERLTLPLASSTPQAVAFTVAVPHCRCGPSSAAGRTQANASANTPLTARRRAHARHPWLPLTAGTSGSAWGRRATVVTDAAAAGGVGGGSGGGAAAGGGAGGGAGGSGASSDGAGKPHPLRAWTWAYAALLAAGGVMAYVKAGSTKSLSSAGGAALILALSGRSMVGPGAKGAIAVCLALSVLLSILMSNRYQRTKKVMPAGLTAGVSLAMCAAYLSSLVG